MDQSSSRTSKDVNVKNDMNKFPEEEDDLGDSIEDGCVNGKQGLDSQIGLEGLNMLTARDVFKMKFDSEENAHAFYNAYAKVMGFSIRKDRKKVRRENVVVSRKWVCSRQGVRAKKYLEHVDRLRAPRAETRVGCKAVFRVRYDVKMREYIVTHFVSEHNHPLVAPHCVPFLWSHRSVTSADKAQTKAMRNVGISTGQIMDLMTIQSGGFDKVGFVRKDLHNTVQADRKVELKDGDAEVILGYLSAKALDDPMFFYKYDVDHENCLDKLFWADSRSRLDYVAFGDVLVFDTTYRTNAYKKPFVMLCGVSNHYMSIIFGCALLPNETTETYMWVLETLMEAMDGKKPISVVTDGDKAMRQAIITVIPNAKHRLCTWHLQRNAVSNVHKPKFHEDFKRLKSLECDRDEFDKAWAVLVKQYNIENNSWVVEVYRNRHKWAESYLRGHFFAGMSSSQRCEGMHAYFNRFLKVRLRLYEFVWHYDRAIARMRVNEAAAEGVTENSFPVLTTQLKKLEKNAAELYTRKIFLKFRAEMELEAKFYVKQQLEEEDHYIYILEQYATENKWRVEFHPFDGSIKCPCMKLESFGIPCCHIITVMKFQQLVSIPMSCVVQRWTRSARSSNPQPSLTKIPNLLTQTTRYGILSSSFNLLSYYASHTDKDFMEAREAGFQMMSEMKKRWELRNADKGEEKNSATKLFGIRDPKVVKTKGNPGGPSSASKLPTARKCGNCRSIGHTKRTCKKVKAKEREGCEEHFSAFTNPELFPHQDEDGR
ncbi:protein FAR1-RELATED SEQUENCE 5-like [Rhododendron vialii]|uniref:protein FAR1-RELATED SEQUENCE 5-like n=1 Tax=Rhododendron vialii TaxID=182163 RepID=UPI00265FA5ED|nr:protein FAR1-RELATED SEQUENCE 5-like [Rhododendron vialii]